MKNRFLKISLIALLLISTSGLYANVKEYYITCNPDDFKAIYKNPWPDTYIPITLTFNDRTWENVTLRIRGDDSRGHPKKSLKLKFEGDAFENGRDVLNFNAEYEDPTYMCQYLASLTFRHIGYPCFAAEHARLYLNGIFLGLYLQIENVDDKFLESRGLDPTGNLYKATEDDASLSIYDDIGKSWEKKTNESGSWNDLQQLIDSLFYVPDNEYYDFAKRTFDYNKMIDIFAVNMLLANGSTYYHNYFMYHDIYFTKKWMMLPWDMDKTFSMYGYYYPYHRSSSYSSPDNPYYERALLCEPIFNDIRDRITQLKDDFFDNEFFDPIIDSLITELEPSVEEDTTDNIPDIYEWLHDTEGPKKYVRERYNILQDQFDQWPRSFKVEPTMSYYSDSIKFVWHPSYHAAGKVITYDFYFGSKEQLDDTNTTTIIKNITDTFYVKTDLPPDGTYWWKVTAYDGREYVDGFNFPNPIKIKQGTELPCTITSDMTLTKEESPYFVNCNIEVKSTADIVINEGVDVIFNGDYRILIRGSLQVNGTKKEPVNFLPDEFTKKWDNIYFHYTTRDCHLKNLNVYNGCFYAQNSVIYFDSLNLNFDYQDTAYALPLMYFDLTRANMYNSTIRSNANRGGFDIIGADNCTVKNNYFYNTPDAIEYSLSADGLIENNSINTSTDDCIDIDACRNIIIRGNIIRNAVDKGITIGNENLGAPSLNILLERNIISGCNTGIVVKDSSTVKAINNTLYKNDVAFSCYEKRLGQGGGFLEIENTIISGTDSILYLDPISTAKISYSLSDRRLMEGESNIMADPMFVDPENYDFSLEVGSPCIDAGNPNSPLDPDGTKVDIGAIPYGYRPELPKIVINEINYNSSSTFDTGDWVEFYNAGSYDVDMSGWVFMDSDNSHKYIFPDNFILKKGAYIVLCRQLDRFTSLYPNIKNILGDFSFGLSSTGELIRLYDNDISLIDSVIYGVSTPWPSESNGNGNTLELISPDFDNALPQSWRNSENYGTPGRLNGTDSLIPWKHEIVSIMCIPNPFDEQTTIRINSLASTKVEIIVYNIFGEEVDFTYNGKLEKGLNEFEVDLSYFPSGVYYCIVKTNEQSSTLVLSHIR
ncbi:MAG: CotH kinase family protein [bacterium]